MIDSVYSVGRSPSAFRHARYLDAQKEELRRSKDAAKRAAIERAKAEAAARMRERIAGETRGSGAGGGNLAPELPAFSEVLEDPAGAAGKLLGNPLGLLIVGLAVVGVVFVVRRFAA